MAHDGLQANKKKFERRLKVFVYIAKITIQITTEMSTTMLITKQAH